MQGLAIVYFLRKFIPYGNIKTKNLTPLLLLARFLLIVGVVLLLLALAATAAIPFLGPEVVSRNFAGMTMTSRTPDRSVIAMMVAIWSFGAAIFTLVLSGVSAALVSFEATYTNRHTHL